MTAASKRPILTLCRIVLAFSAAAAAVQIVLYLVLYSEEEYVYAYGAALPSVFYWVLAAVTAALLVLVYARFSRENTCVCLDAPNRTIAFFALLCGFFFAVSALIHVVYAISGLGQEYSGVFPKIMHYASVVCAVPSAVYFLMVALHDAPPRGLDAVCGSFVVLWLIARTFCLYFDTATPHASPARKLGYVVLVFLMNYMILELRLVLQVPRPRRHLAFGIAFLPVLAVGTIPNAVLSLIGRRSYGAEMAYPFVLLCLFCYVSARMYSVCSGRASLHPATFAGEQPEDSAPPKPDHEENGHQA